MNDIAKMDLRINILTEYLLSHKNIAVKVVVNGKKRPNYSVQVFKKIKNVAYPICVIGTFKGSFGFIFDAIYDEHRDLVEKLFNFKILSELSFTTKLFDAFNKNELFMRVFQKINPRKLTDYYQRHDSDISSKSYVLIDPVILPSSFNQNSYLKFREKDDLLMTYLRFEIFSAFEIYPDGVIYPFPVINLMNNNIIGQFPIDLINKQIYFEKHSNNRENMHNGIIIPSSNKKFLPLSDDVIHLQLFEFLNNHLDKIYGKGRDLADDIINIPFENIKEKVDIFEMTYFM
jgi:hypothetical protein